MHRLTRFTICVQMLWVMAGSAMATDSASSTVQQSQVTTQGPKNVLGGTLTTPSRLAGPASAVALIIPGSGRVDKDGNSSGQITGSPYEQLAIKLAAQGIASVRIDKRGFFSSKDGIDDPNLVTLDDYAADVQSWLTKVKAVTGKRCVWIIGHSEGALIAELASKSSAESICGLVLIGMPGHRLDVIVKDQIDRNPANKSIRAAADSAIDQLASGHNVETASLPPPLKGLFAEDKQGLWKSELSLDPAKRLKEIAAPILVIEGGKDIQVPATEADVLKSANSRAKIVVIHGMNHVLKSVTSDDLLGNIKTYADPNVPMAPSLAPTIADFIRAHSRT